MKKISNYSIRATIVLIVTAVLILNLGQGIQIIEKSERNLSLSSLIPHDPISITSDSGLEVFLGSGTIEDPHIIEGYNITTTDDNGIYISLTTKYFTVRNCYVDAKYNGIYIDDVADGTATVVNNTCSNNNDYGIYLYISSTSIITNNTCSYNNDCGIYLYLSGSSTVAKNTCNNNVNYGISIDSSGSATVINNACTDNDRGIYLQWSSSSTIANNTCNFNIYGIRLYNSGRSTVANNTCKNNWKGISLSSSSSTITNNTCSNNSNGCGIYLYNSGRSTVANNTCNNNIDGIYLSSSGSTITNNTCSNNNNYGIVLSSSGSSTVINNTCSYNNDYGIYLTYSDSCLITYNLLQENEKYGICIGYDSDNNLIHHNTFVDNLGGYSQAYDEGTDNYWYDTATQEGNDWSDWSGTGSYFIDGRANSVDLYPLGEPLIVEYPQIVLLALLLSIVPLFLTRIISKKVKKQ